MTTQPLLVRRRSGRSGLALLLVLLLLVLASVAHLGLGARTIGPQTVVRAFLAFDLRNFDHQIIISLRLLRLVAALMVGAALGVAGALLQTVIRNPLGEPHILGLNAGAALAVVATTALGLAFGPGQPLIAACGAGALFALVMGIASAGKSGLTPMTVTLCGVALTAFTSSLTAAILILDEQTLLAMRTWLAGDLAGLRWEAVRTAGAGGSDGAGSGTVGGPGAQYAGAGGSGGYRAGDFAGAYPWPWACCHCLVVRGGGITGRADRFYRAGRPASGAPFCYR